MNKDEIMALELPDEMKTAISSINTSNSTANGVTVQAGRNNFNDVKNLTFVTITSEQVKDIVKDLKQNVISEKENTIKFGNSIPHDELIKKLSKYKIDRILIEEATLEDVFMHYYQ